MSEVECKAHGIQNDEYGESATRWCLFSLAQVESELDSLDDYRDKDGCLDDDLIARDLLGWERSYGGPGRWFWASPWVIVKRQRVLVKQNGGLDI